MAPYSTFSGGAHVRKSNPQVVRTELENIGVLRSEFNRMEFRVGIVPPKHTQKIAGSCGRFKDWSQGRTPLIEQ